MIYRSLLREAWNIAWQNKSLWIFGIFAGLISTGGVVDIAILGMKRAAFTGSLLTNLLDRTFIGYAYASEFILYLTQTNSSLVTLTVAIGTIFLIGLVACAIISQAALIHAAGNPNKHPHEIRQHVLPHFWDVFLVDITTKILFAILTVLLTLPVLLFLQNNNDLAPTILLIYFMIFIPAVIILHIISILALVDVVETKSNALNAFHTAIRIFKKQWLSSIEFGFILFVILFVAIFILITILILLSIPFGFIGTAILVSGSPFLFFSFNILTGLFLLALMLVFGGALVTFQYSAWRFFYKRAEHKTFGLKPFSKLWRMVID